MSVPSQVINYLICSGKWLLGVDNPGGFVKTINKFLLLWQFLLKRFYKLTPKDPGKVLYPEQKHFAIFRGSYLFPLPPVIDSTSWNNAMNMRVKTQILSPGMQYGHHARFCMQLRVRELSKSLPCAGKKQVIKICRMLKKQAIEHVRYRKNNMKIWYREKILFAVLNPCFTLSILALGTMTVTARVVTNADMTALIAFINMSAQ